MLICLEGPDASGKSTLAHYLANALGVPVQHSEGPPQYPGEMTHRLERYAQLPPDTIFDRHPCVSEEIYSWALRRDITVTSSQQSDFYARKPFFIYCHPPLSVMMDHVLKPHDNPEHITGLLENHHRVIEAYRSWAITHAHVIYRIGDSMDRILHFVTDFVGDIAAFHQKFQIDYDGPPHHLPEELREFRTNFLLEEVCEYAGLPDALTAIMQTAARAYCQAKAPTPLYDEFDALIDLVYVALGTAHMQGFPFREGWSRVHRANMTKIRALRADDSKRGSTYDVVKPPNFVPPDLTDLVVRRAT